jgi:hypothetical protein
MMKNALRNCNRDRYIEKYIAILFPVQNSSKGSPLYTFRRDEDEYKTKGNSDDDGN